MPRRLVLALLAAVTVSMLAPPASGGRSFVQPLSKVWDTASIDVLLVPPGIGQVYNGNGPLNGSDLRELDAYENSYMRAMEDSIADWRRAVGAWGPRWLAKGLKLKVYVLGRQEPPSSALTDPEIVVQADAHKGPILGMAVYFADACVVNNSRFFASSFTYADMYNINLHEFGHCLGLDHVFAANQEAKELRRDPMHEFYQEPVGAAATPRHCPSTLNVRGLVESFRPSILGEPADRSPRLLASRYRVEVVPEDGRCF